MHTKKAKYHLKRIETILNLHEGSLSALDRDILLEDIRRLYDLILYSETDYPVQEPQEPRDHTIAPSDTMAVQSAEPKATADTSGYENTASPSDIQNQPPVTPSQATFHPIPEEILPEDQEEKSTTDDNLRHTPTTITYQQSVADEEVNLRNNVPPLAIHTEKSNGQMQPNTALHSEDELSTETLTKAVPNYPELFDFPASSDLSDRLGNSKIEHLNRILTINDKILFINHLFGGEAIPFQESLKKFESFYTYEEATQYAARDLVDVYQWTKSEKFDIVRQFMRQVKRLYN